MESGIVIINTDNIQNLEPEMEYSEVKRIQSEGNNPNTNLTIMVQAYGRLEKTKKCVESILKYTNVPYRLVLEDNGTVDDEVMDYFNSIDYKDKTVVKITKNITGVYGINQVMKQVDTKYFIMVANDIIVTPRWAENLMICAESDERIGIVTPVSTNISNNQMETLGGFETDEEMFYKAEAFNRSNPKLWEERIRLIPTATLYRTEVFQEVGLYDTGFIHDFGDDDYTFRVRRAGYKLILCRDTFVHHNHNVFVMEDKDVERANQIARKGRKDFGVKHFGLDAWDDTNNSIAGYLSTIHKKEREERKKILAIEPKCGVPVLDLKNYYRSQGIFNVECEAFSSEVKYFTDLRSICQKVTSGSVNELNRYYHKYMFDAVVLCKSLNLYDRTEELIEFLYDTLKIGGILLFSIKNVCDYRNFLYSLNVISLREQEKPKILYFQDVYEQLRQYGATNVNVLGENHFVQSEIVNEVKQLYQKMLAQEDVEQIVNNLFINRYWFVIEK